MKKFIALLLAMMMCLSFAACDNKTAEDTTNSVDTTTSADTTVIETEPPEPEILTAQLKETVSTDIVDFTLEHSKLTYYVSNSSSTYVEPTEKANSLFAAKIGTCYVSLTVTITNKDRGGSIDFGGIFCDWSPSRWTVTYGNNNYKLYGFDLNSDKSSYISLSEAAFVDKDTGKIIRIGNTSNTLIYAGTTQTIRFFGIIEVDPASLNDGFELNVKVPNSKGAFEEFKYIVPAIS